MDGENFRHSIVDLFYNEFRSDDYLPKNAKWGELFDWVAKTVGSPDATRLRAYWYVIEHVDFYPYRIPDLKQERRIDCSVATDRTKRSSGQWTTVRASKR